MKLNFQQGKSNFYSVEDVNFSVYEVETLHSCMPTTLFMVDM